MLGFFQNLSLKLKLTVFTLSLFLLAIGVSTYAFSTHMRQELAISLSNHQFSEVSYVAEHIDSSIKQRIDSLSLLAQFITPRLMSHRDQLSSFLAQQKSLNKIFTLGTVVISKEGKSITALPVDFARYDFYRRPIATGKPFISTPPIDEIIRDPSLVIAVPIFDQKQNLIGILAGIASLSDSSFINEFDKKSHPDASSYLVISPRDNLYISATDKKLLFKPLPVAGVDAMHDRYMNGFEGSGIALSSRGVEELSSAKRIISTGWFVTAFMPTDQVFERITHIRNEAILVASAVSLISIFLFWLFLRHELSALERSVIRIQRLSFHNEQATLPLEGCPEIRKLQSSFNQLQMRIARDAESLRENEALYRAMFENNTAIKWLIDIQTGAIIDANAAAANFYGWPVERLREMNITQINTLPTDAIRQEMSLANAQQRPFFRFKHRLASGKIRDVEVHSSQVDFGGKKLLYSIITDVTERELALNREMSCSTILGNIASGKPSSEILNNIIQMVEVEQPGASCVILQVTRDGKKLALCAAPSLPPAFQSLLNMTDIGDNVSPCSSVAARGKRTVINDLQSRTYSPEFSGLARQANLLSCWTDPILSSTNSVMGVFSVYWRHTCEPNAEQLALLEQVRKLVSITLERKQDDESLRLSASVFQTSADAITITDEENHIIAVNPAFSKITQYSPEEVLGKDPKILSSGIQGTDFYNAMWQSIIMTGKWQGEIFNRRKDGEVYSEWLNISTVYDGQNNVQQRIAIFSDISEVKRTEAIIWQQANYDTLTALPNRRLFHDRLAQELKKSERDNIPLALMFIDLDHFKEVNDTLGHEAGDSLLQEAAHRIAKCVRDSDTVARLGGDEFTVILPGGIDTERLESIARCIINTLSTPFIINELPVYVSASIGITIYPNDAGNISSLLKNADQAMYVAKSKGRNQFSYFTSSMQESAHMRLQLSNDLRVALEADQFEVYYQPIVELATGLVSKAEALVRWHHPSLGLVSPTVFIPLAEDLGLINAIGDWVFRQSALQALSWHLNKAHDLQHIQISINKSPRQFGASHLNMEVIEWLRKLALPPTCIVMEITEGLLMDDRTEVKNTLLAYRDAGIQVSLDDFGTGYSAMSYLQRFDIDYIKIDQSFVRNMVNNVGDQAIVEAIIVMAHKLGMKVIAEGVETAQQRDILATAGCDYGQGYLFARPMPATQFDEFLSQATIVG